MGRQNFPVACICGSMRFHDGMLKVAADLSAGGYIVLFPFVAFSPGSMQESAEKQMLDEMHLTKIDMARDIFVVTDSTRYWGDSTSREIDYAREHHKWVQVAQVFAHADGYKSVTYSSLQPIAKGSWSKVEQPPVAN